jgi:hypothetical protein
MIPIGFCQCGCGQRTNLAVRTNPRLGYIIGQPHRFVIGHGRWANSLEHRLWSRIEKCGPDECWPWHGAHTPAGYGLIYRNGSMTTASHVVYELTYGPLSQNQIVCHTCDNPPCCNPSHLFAGTDKTNSDDKLAKGREGHPDNRGVRNPHVRLTEPDVLEIRAAHLVGSSLSSLATQYGVNIPAIWKIIKRRTWKHI